MPRCTMQSTTKAETETDLRTRVKRYEELPLGQRNRRHLRSSNASIQEWHSGQLETSLAHLSYSTYSKPRFLTHFVLPRYGCRTHCSRKRKCSVPPLFKPKRHAQCHKKPSLVSSLSPSIRVSSKFCVQICNEVFNRLEITVFYHARVMISTG